MINPVSLLSRSVNQTDTQKMSLADSFDKTQTETVEIGPLKRTGRLWVVLLLAFVVGSAWVAGTGEPGQRIVGGAAALLLGTILMGNARRWWQGEAVLIVRERGLQHRGLGVIPYRDIAALKIVPGHSLLWVPWLSARLGVAGRRLLIELDESQRDLYLSRCSWWLRLMYRLAPGPITISLLNDFVSCGVEHLVDVIEWRAAPASISNRPKKSAS